MRRIHITLFIVFLLFSTGIFCNATLKLIPVNGKGSSSWLLDQAINCIAQDDEGYIWISSFGGILRYDGSEFEFFSYNPDDPHSISDNNAREIVPDSFRGGIWICTGNGLDYFNPEKGKFEHAKHVENDGSISVIKGRINDILVLSNKIICCGSSTVYICDTDEKDLVFHKTDLGFVPISICKYDDETFLAGNHDGAYLLRASDLEILSFAPFSSSEYSSSFVYYSQLTDRIYLGNGIGTQSAAFRYEDGHLKRDKCFVPDNLSRVCDSNGKTLFGTNGNGLYILEDGKVSQITTAEGLNSNVVSAFCHDKQDNLWIGLYRGGLWLNQKNMDSFSIINSFKLASSILPEKDFIYVGTDNYGLGIYDRKDGSIRMLDTSNSSLPGNHIVSMCKTEDEIWIGIYTKGICSFNLQTEEINTYSLEDHDELYVDNNKVWIVVKDGSGRIWVGGPSLFIFSRENKKFTKVRDLGGKFISAISFHDDVAYVSTRHSGVFKIDINSLEILDKYDTQTVNGFPENDIRYIYMDRTGKLWFSTQSFGLYSLEVESKDIERYDESDGLFNNNVTVINEDEDGNMWFGTMNGLHYYSAGRFIHLGNRGYVPEQYIYSATHKDEKHLYFGSTDGLVILEKDKVEFHRNPGKVCFTELTTLSDEPLVFPLYSSTPSPISLKSEDNFFRVSLSVPEFITPESIQFSCRMIGLEKDWRNLGDHRTLTYTGLKAGEYELQVRYSYIDNDWSEASVLKIDILPKWYATWWAKILWSAIVTAILATLTRLYLRQRKIKEEIRISEIEKNSIREINEAKLDFFTRITHDLRTPIFLITTQLEVLADQDSPKISVSKSHFDSLLRNSKKLTRLVNKLIDFRKLNSDTLGLKLRESDIVTFCKNLVSDYAELCSKKDITFSFNCPDHPVLLSFDHEKVESILSNLVSNAFKYTQDGGHVEMLISENETGVNFQVKDNGIGILPENLESIFDYFSRTERGIRQGSGDGIGLAVVKSFVELHGGSITVFSTPNIGSTFSFTIPFGLISRIDQTSIILDDQEEHESQMEQISVTNPAMTQSILIIDDNSETVDLIERCLESSYRIFKATNGEDGYKIAEKMLPNLVICDLDMPSMNGHDFLARLRMDKKLDCIKVIILTGDNSEEEMLRTLSEGADAHLMKPVSLKLLKVRISKLIKQSEENVLMNDVLESREKYTNEEQVFLLKCKEIIDDHITDDDFSMEFMAKKLAMSHSLLYKKIKTITGLSLIGFVNDYKISKAVLLFRQGETNVTSVCERCGFKDEKNFRDLFKRKIGLTPKQYVLNNTKH